MNRIQLALLTAVAFSASIGTSVASAADGPKKNFYDFTVKNIDGKEVPLSKYKGKVVLVVNVASRCGYTPQYEGLQKIHEKYKEQGLVVLGFPANEFGSQEPGSDEEIKTFCTSKYNVDFDMFSKLVVKGSDKAPLFDHLTKTAKPAGEIKWNFEKFLIDRQGKVVKRFKSADRPDGKPLTSLVEAELAKT